MHIPYNVFERVYIYTGVGKHNNLLWDFIVEATTAFSIGILGI